MILLFIIFAVIAMIDFVPLLKEKSRRDAVITGIVLCSGLVLSVLYALGVELPSPIVIMERFLRDNLKIGY
ncbi:hypothetical protein U6B65_00775 [Oscillospiraceae bacterium MB08-C2-2]|nr:hypothetical protein U6B65_00775 [Oscillospiraceae bacterium MB08-C2-2]